jgi:hypothetical protein
MLICSSAHLASSRLCSQVRKGALLHSFGLSPES